MINFTKQIVSIPSLPGKEAEVAAAIQKEMINLGYDKVWTDTAGNVIGKINGGDGPSIILNGHIDHVDPGALKDWPYPPFSGEIVNGELWGRASVDMKGPVACMIYATSLFKQLGITPPGNIFMTAVVMEEVGGIGTQHLVSHLKAQAAICGEPSNNILRRGHRGRVELSIQFKGRSAHASTPHLGENPHYLAASFLKQLSTLTMAQDDVLGFSTVVPTLYSTDQSSANVIPGQINLTLDWRNVASETPSDILTKIQGLMDHCLIEDSVKLTAPPVVKIATDEVRTYTGMQEEYPSLFPPFLLSEDNPYVQAAQTALINTLGQNTGNDIWRFATDGGHLMAAGIPTIGFGPGNDALPHTNQERINLAQMEDAMVGYVGLTLALAEAAKRN